MLTNKNIHKDLQTGDMVTCKQNGLFMSSQQAFSGRHFTLGNLLQVPTVYGLQVQGQNFKTGQTLLIG